MDQSTFVAPPNQTTAVKKLLPCPFSPSGIQMTRDVQPPPMYGPRGPTIPPKHLPVYINNRHRPHINRSNNNGIQRRPYFKPIRQPHANLFRPSQAFLCESCDRDFSSVEQFQQHKREHRRCGIDGCQFEGHEQVVSKHIEQQHSSGLYDRIKNLTTPEDLAKWREERRKRYPTKQNIELRQQLQAEKQKRGERLEESKSRFGRKCDRRNPVSSNCKNDMNKRKKEPRKRNRKSYKKQNKFPDKIESSSKSLAAESVENNLAEKYNGWLNMFKGTRHFSNYKRPSTKQNALSNILGAYGSSSDDSNDSDSEELNCNLTVSKCQENNSQIEENKDRKPAKMNFTNTTGSINESIKKENNTTMYMQEDEPNSSDMELPDECPVQRQNEIFQQNDVEISETAKESNAIAKKKHKEPINDVKTKEKPTTLLDLSKRYRNQNTMLEKLLQKEIRHERNILLQCIRYVCQKNFFGINYHKIVPQNNLT